MSTATAPPPPDNIFKLKNTLEDLKTILEKPDKSGKIDTLNSEVNSSLGTVYSAMTHTTHELDSNEQKIKSIEAFNKKFSTFVTACETYVTAAKAIFDGLDSSISGKIIVDKDYYTDLKTDIPDLLKYTIAAIDKLKKEEPVASSGGTVLTDEEKEINAHLNALTTFLNDMVAELIATIKTNIGTEFSDAEIKKMVEIDPTDFGKTIADQVNKICKNILQYVDKKEREFKDLLNKESNTSITTPKAKIILDASSIATPFDAIIAELQKYFAQGSTSGNTFFKVVDPFYYKEIQALIDKINKEVVGLIDVPEMSDDAAPVSGTEVGGGGGNGNASTFAAYPVSNKSHKNRNNGNGNSRGKGKGKGKSKNRKPNATKKNNRH